MNKHIHRRTRRGSIAVQRSMHWTAADQARIGFLAALWECSDIGACRRALQETAAREGFVLAASENEVKA